MNDITARIASMSAEVVAKVRQYEDAALTLPQVPIDTHHTFHAGLYARTIVIPEGVIVTGALIKIPTILIVSGDVVLYREDGPLRLTGYHVLLGSTGRKQVAMAIACTTVTMLFATSATTIAEAEAEFTDETEQLLSRRDGNTNEITKEEQKCLEAQAQRR